MLVKRELILLKVESTYNTDPSPVAGTDAILAMNLLWAHANARVIDRENIRAALDTTQKIYGGSLMTISFDVEMKGSGAAGTAPEIGQALRACGFGETVVASTSVAYAPVSSSVESCTIHYYQDGKRKILTGARGNVKFNWSAGGIPMASFVFTGHIGTESDQSLPSGTFDSTTPVGLVGLSSFSVDSYAAVINALEFSMNNNIAVPPSIAAADGFGEIQITGRDVAGSFDPEDVILATKDFIADWKADGTGALDTGVHGATAGNRIQVAMPALAYRDIGMGEREGVRTLEVGFGAGISSGDDEVTITFT